MFLSFVLVKFKGTVRTKSTQRTTKFSTNIVFHKIINIVFRNAIIPLSLPRFELFGGNYFIEIFGGNDFM